MHLVRLSSLFLLGVATAIRRPLPADPAVSRDAIVRGTVRAALLAPAAAASALIALQAARLGGRLDVDADPLSAQLRSSNELAPSRRRLEAEWRALGKEPAGRAQTEDAFERVLRVRRALGRAEDLVRESKMRELDAAVPLSLVRELECAATILARSAVLSSDARTTIGWQWGACGWRQCGAQADAAQALCKLRANLGMVVPMEALFYLDVAKRSVDEMLAVGVSGGWLPATALGERNYLSRDQLELVLPPEDLQSGDANLPVMRGGLTEAEESLEDYEAAQMEALRSLTDADQDGS